MTQDVLNQSVSELKHIDLHVYILKYISLDVINTVFNSKFHHGYQTNQKKILLHQNLIKTLIFQNKNLLKMKHSKHHAGEIYIKRQRYYLYNNK